MTLIITSVSVAFGSRQILNNVSLTVPTGEVVALTGPSGSGKSTLLKVVAGLLLPDAGSVGWDGEALDSIPTHLRRVGMVFQDRVLFPHLNVGKNVAFGLNGPRQTKTRRVEELLKLVGLTSFASRSVASLSGGEAQRVALARALAPNPRVLLLDEPLGALDVQTRRALTTDLRQTLKDTGATAIHVTHDLEEATQVADRVVAIGSLAAC